MKRFTIDPVASPVLTCSDYPSIKDRITAETKLVVMSSRKAAPLTTVFFPTQILSIDKRQLAIVGHPCMRSLDMFSLFFFIIFFFGT